MSMTEIATKADLKAALERSTLRLTLYLGAMTVMWFAGSAAVVVLLEM